MKGGGFLILLFLLICFLWGVTSVVGRISRIFSSKRDRELQTEKTVLSQELEPEPPIQEQSPLAAPERPRKKDLDHTLAQLERINKLRNEGVLTEEEFLQIKVKLIQASQSD